MVQEALKPLGGHAVFLLLVQLALILCAARLGAELAKRLGLPAVVGELAAGIVLGPSMLGHFAPHAFAWVFPHESAQFNLLEVVGSLGMVLLLLLTGLETDLRLLKNLGRAALIASAMGMLIPFGTGYLLGVYMPDSYLAQPDHRGLFAAFLATAMSISAMPVIAKILMDLDLTRRNMGLVILSAGVVDDTVGWLILSVIAGAASHGEVRFGSLLTTIGFAAMFLIAMAVVVYPMSRVGMTLATRRFKTPDADLVLVLCTTFLCAAATEHIGIHAAFGAFVAGTMFRQVPQLRGEVVHRLESFVFPVLAPVFFATVGLKVDLWALGGGKMLGIVLGVACFGKLFGCTLGGIWGGLRFWEAFSIAAAMNARGAMELVVATIGLSLGILNQQMFSIIVVVAIATSFMAPIALRLTMKKVRMTDEEARRMLLEQLRGVFDPQKVRVLFPSSGGPNSPAAALFVSGLTSRSMNPVELLSVQAPARLADAILSLFRRNPDNRELEAHLASLRELLAGGQQPSLRKLTHRSAAQAILIRAQDSFDLIALGASQRGHVLGGPLLEDVVEAAPCHVVIVKSGSAQQPSAPFRRLLVPYDGGVFARVAVELAVRYAEATSAEMTIAVLAERPNERPAQPDAQAPIAVVNALAPTEIKPLAEGGAMPTAEGTAAPADEEELGRISNLFRVSEIRPRLLRLGHRPGAMSEEAANGKYDLVVLGAENRAIQHRLFFGHENERLIEQSKVTVAIVVPNMVALSKEDPSAISALQRPRATPFEGAPRTTS